MGLHSLGFFPDNPASPHSCPLFQLHSQALDHASDCPSGLVTPTSRCTTSLLGSQRHFQLHLGADVTSSRMVTPSPYPVGSACTPLALTTPLTSAMTPADMVTLTPGWQPATLHLILFPQSRSVEDKQRAELGHLTYEDLEVGEWGSASGQNPGYGAPQGHVSGGQQSEQPLCYPHGLQWCSPPHRARSHLSWGGWGSLTPLL